MSAAASSVARSMCLGGSAATVHTQLGLATGFGPRLLPSDFPTRFALLLFANSSSTTTHPTSPHKRPSSTSSKLLLLLVSLSKRPPVMVP
ncbi:hypothetical protein BD289DRAFT_485832 [Coniella lustricola]|uniref:Uncharacterized protein n=1 Tax=Coniella lustricola TaxID=2025994 RepID=A0A2T2ZX97_9PEZI|nr:hypothetical protein BD289DRAFT_485832 [Coniella lustricola]